MTGVVQVTTKVHTTSISDTALIFEGGSMRLGAVDVMWGQCY